jgi:hypothetical protein
MHKETSEDSARLSAIVQSPEDAIRLAFLQQDNVLLIIKLA